MTGKKTIKSRLLYTVLILFSAMNGFAEPLPDDRNTMPCHPFFSDQSLLHLEIIMDIAAIRKDVGKNRGYHHVLIRYSNHLGDTVPVKAGVCTRGHYRRQRTHCNFPPLQFRFSDSLSRGTIFNKFNRLKLVTHCRTRRKDNEQYILKEYLVYRMYQLFCQESYRVRLARITYRNSRGNKKPVVKFGFFIEPTNMMAARNGMEPINTKNIHQEGTDREYRLVGSRTPQHQADQKG